MSGPARDNSARVTAAHAPHARHGRHAPNAARAAVAPAWDDGPHAALAAALLPLALGGSSGGRGVDGAHDAAHLRRVWRNAFRIADGEAATGRPAGDAAVLAAAVLLHDCVAVEKDSPLRAQASRLAATEASAALRALGWPVHRVEAAAHAIEAHAFSAGVEPLTPEARILQDADRLDAIGAIGVARCFCTAGRLGSSLYDPDDPLAERRALDDRAFALDHFEAKLLRLATGFRTATGRRLAAARARRLRRFRDALLDEI